jgi:hypothetical protein
MPQEHRKDPEAALRFIPRDDLECEGYGEYRRLFQIWAG